jgi:hypothetical protein
MQSKSLKLKSNFVMEMKLKVLCFQFISACMQRRNLCCKLCKGRKKVIFLPSPALNLHYNNAQTKRFQNDFIISERYTS